MVNPHGRGTVVLICEHASHFIPPAYGGLGLSPADQVRHIGWDIGALGLALELAGLLDAPLVHANYSRLLLDLNRAGGSARFDRRSAAKTRTFPATRIFPRPSASCRSSGLYEPFHRELDALIDQRLRAGLDTAVRFDPFVHAASTTACAPLARRRHLAGRPRDGRRHAALAARRMPSLCVGDNCPMGRRTAYSTASAGMARRAACPAP